MTIRASESSWSALTEYRSRAEGVDHGARCGLAKLQTVKLATRARAEGVSLNALVLTFIAQGLGSVSGKAVGRRAAQLQTSRHQKPPAAHLVSFRCSLI